MRDLAGTGHVVRHVLRRDRWVLPAWLAATWMLAVSRAASVATTYPDAAARQLRYDAVMHDVPMFRLFQGPAYGDSAGALVAQETFAGATLLAALWACLLVVRHTRAEEQAGQTELVRSGAVGRHAPLAAALSVVLGAGTLLGLVVTGSLVGVGMPAAGSAAFGLIVLCAVGLGAGLAAVAAQLTTSHRLAAWGAFLLVMAMNFVRGAGDLAGGSAAQAAWAVPTAWLQRTRPYADERWWPFLPAVALVALLVVAAFALSTRRDLEATVFPVRAGRVAAAPSLRNPVALAWRQHRTAAVAWTVVLFAIALPTGLAGPAAMESYATSDAMARWAAAMGSTEPGDAFFAYIAFTMVFPVTIYALTAMLRVVEEERSGRGDASLSAPVSRIRWIAGHLAVATAVPVVLELVIGLGFGLGSGQLGTMLRTTMVLVPAIWVMVGVAVAVFGLAPRAAAVAPWVVFAVALLAELGQHLGWPTWTFLTFSPFAHVMPFYGVPSPVTLAALAAIAAGLTAVGVAALRRRDLVAG